MRCGGVLVRDNRGNNEPDQELGPPDHGGTGDEHGRIRWMRLGFEKRRAGTGPVAHRGVVGGVVLVGEVVVAGKSEAKVAGVGDELVAEMGSASNWSGEELADGVALLRVSSSELRRQRRG